MIVHPEFKDAKYDFPSQDIDPQLKLLKEYQLEMSQAIYANHLRGNSAFPLNEDGVDSTLREYLIGRMSISKYKGEDVHRNHNVTSLFDNEDVQGSPNGGSNKQKGWKDINWQPLNPMAKIHNAVQGQLEPIEYDIVANAVDQLSVDEKEYNKLRLLVIARNKQWIEQMTAQMGTGFDFPDFLPENQDELELYELSGGLKLTEEIKLEQLIKHTVDISDWKMMKKSYISDLLSIGKIAVRAYYDHYTHKIKWKYVDPTPGKLAIQFVKEDEFDNSDWVALVSIKTLGEVDDALELEGMPKEERQSILLSICREYSSTLGNPEYTENLEKEVNVNSSWIWSGWKVEVLETFWIDNDTEKRLITFFPNYSTERTYELNWDETIKKTGKKAVEGSFNGNKSEIKRNTEKKSYHTKWIIGTTTVYGGGLTEDVIWIDDKPQLPVKVIRLRNQSATKLALPWIDELENAWFNYQNECAQLWTDMMAFDIDAISNIVLANNEKMSEMDVIRMAKEKKVIIYRKKDALNHITTQQVPVSRVSGTSKENLELAMQRIEFAATKIEYFTGYNPLSTGGQPAERQGEGTAQIAINATANITKPLINAIFELKGKMADYSAFAIHHLIKTNPKAKKAYEDVIGTRGVEIIEASSKSHRQMSIILEPRPTEEIKQDLKKFIEQSLAGGKNGNAILDTDDPMMMWEMINNGIPMKEVWRFSAGKIKEKRKEKEKQSQQAAQQQSQQNMQLQQQKSQNESQFTQQQHQMKIDEMMQETKGIMMVEFAKANPNVIPNLIPDLKDVLKEQFPMLSSGQSQQNQQSQQPQEAMPQ